MPYTKEIEAEARLEELCSIALQEAWVARDEAERTHRKAEHALADVQASLLRLRRLASGLKPYLCGKPYSYVHHGDAYRETAVSGIEETVVYWTAKELAEKKANRQVTNFDYVVLLADDAKTYKALIHLNENANIKAGQLRKLLRLEKG
jgi:hypothetical protein